MTDDSQAIASMAAALARKKAAKKRKQKFAVLSSSSSMGKTIPIPPAPPPIFNKDGIINGGGMDIASLAAAAARQRLEQTNKVANTADTVVANPPPPSSIVQRVPMQHLQRELLVDDDEHDDSILNHDRSNDGGNERGALFGALSNRQKRCIKDEMKIPQHMEKGAPIHSAVSPRQALLSAIQIRQSAPSAADDKEESDACIIDDAENDEGNTPMRTEQPTTSGILSRGIESDSDEGNDLYHPLLSVVAFEKRSALSPPKRAAESKRESDGGMPMSIAAMAAAAAQKRASLSPPKRVESSNDRGMPMSIAAMAAAAAQKRSSLSPPKRAAECKRDSDGGMPMSIAAMAAAAAQKRSSLSPPKRVESNNDRGMPMSIAALAAAAAQKRSSLSPPKRAAIDSSVGSPVSVVGHWEKMSLSSVPPRIAFDGKTDASMTDAAPPPMSIAAMAAAAARKKTLSPPTLESDEEATTCAYKKASSPKALAVSGPTSIAALAAAAAQKKASTRKSSDDSGRRPTIAASAAAAVTPPKASHRNGSPWDESDSRGPSLSISTMAAEAQKKTKVPFSPPKTAFYRQQHHNQPARAQNFSLPQRAQQQRKPKNIIIQQHCRRCDRQSLPRAYNSPKDIHALELHKKRREKIKLEAQRNNLQLLETRGRMRQIHASLGGNGTVDLLERLVVRQNTSSSAASSHSYKVKYENACSSTNSDVTKYIVGRPHNATFTQLQDDSNFLASSVSNERSRWSDVEGPFRRCRKLGCCQSTHEHEQEQSHPHNDFTVLTLASLRSSAMPSRSLDKVRERRKRQIYQNVADIFDCAEESPCEVAHDKAVRALLQVIENRNIDLDNVIKMLEDLNRRQKRRGGSHGGRDKENCHQQRRVSNTDPLSTPKNDIVHDDDSSIGDISTESADHLRLAKNAHKLANYVMQTPQQKFTSKKIPLKEDPEYNLYFRMLTYGFTMGAVRAALSRDGKPDMTRLDPDRPLCVQKVPRALDNRFHRLDSIEVSGLEIGRDGITDEGWEHVLSSVRAREASDPLRTRLSGPPATLPPWLNQNQADRGIVQGWLRKKTRRGRFVRRWYYLDATGIYYSHAPPTSRNTSSKSGKYTKLSDTRALSATKTGSNPLEFELWHEPNSHALVTLRAHSLIELNEWVDAVSNASERQRLVDEVFAGHLDPAGDLRNKGGVLSGDGSRDSVDVGVSQKDRTDNTGGSGDDLGNNSGRRGDGFGSDSFGLGDGTGGRCGGTSDSGTSTGRYGSVMRVAVSSRNLQSVMDGESLVISGDMDPLVPSAALDEAKKLFMEGSCPLIPQISISNPEKRPMLKRQNSWPPISLMSNGDFARIGLHEKNEKKKTGDDSWETAANEKKPDESKDLQLGVDGKPQVKSVTEYAEHTHPSVLKNDTSKESLPETRESDLDPEKALEGQQGSKEDVGDGDPSLKNDKRFAKYFKMMKMGLPKEAAKHAMKRDGIEDDSILDLDPDKSLKSQQAPKGEDSEPVLKEDPKYKKYFKMIKMGLPKDAAKHAMNRDGIEDDSILELDPEKSLKSQQAPKREDSGPVLKEDPKYKKYFKMMKMGLPKEAAKHAMVRDQHDPSILDLDPESSLESQMGGGEEDTGPPLKDDPKFAKYFKMMKMGLPMGAVKNALTRDGLDPGIMDLNHDKPVSSQLDAKKKNALKVSKTNKKPKIRRKKVYWTQVDAKEGTVWQAVKSSEIELDINIDEFERLFTQAVDVNKEGEKKEKGPAKSSKKSGIVKVIDSKRGMNGDIILKKVKLSPTEVATLVENMDTGTLDAAELKSLYEFMPTDEEIKGLTAYLESSRDETEEIRYMTPCEQYMVAMKDLKDSDKKFQCIIFLSQFGNKMKELKWDVDHLSAACKQLRTSKRFSTLLKMILTLVNKINTGEDGGAVADGFTLNTLVKLNETKAFDNKTTVLYYLVKLIRETNIDVLKFKEDIKDVVVAKGVVMERLLTSAKQLCEDARVAEETATKDGDLYRQSLKNPSEQWKFTNKFTNVTAQRRSVNEIRQMVTFSTERDVPVCKVNSTHFERFAAFAKLELQQALEVIKEAHQQFTETLDFFCEDTNTQVGDFFGIIDQFMIAFDKTQEQVERDEEDKLKAARRTLAKEARLKVKPAFKNAVAVDASKISDEKPSTLLLPSMNSTTRFDIDAAESNDGDSRHALFAAIKSRLVENIQQDEEVAVIAESESHQWQKEEVLEEARPKKEAKKQDATLRVKIEAEEELNRQKAELRARIDAIERARREEEERNESARKAEEDCKSEELERRKFEQEEHRIRKAKLFRREHTDPKNLIEHRDEAKEAEEVHREREARKQMKKALRDKIMAKEKAERAMELRASFTEELREQQEDKVEDSLRAWLAKKEKKSPSNIASSSNGSTGRCRPEFSRQPSRLSMAVAQAAAAKQRRESAVVTSTTS